MLMTYLMSQGKNGASKKTSDVIIYRGNAYPRRWAEEMGFVDDSEPVDREGSYWSPEMEKVTIRVDLLRDALCSLIFKLSLFLDCVLSYSLHVPPP